ncbi:phospholipase [Halieaceae bacterium IMCC14734]|uniref:Phospholipase n=1 Tax=Candidatus Litorirhabdus singularis TaxID=2518993 RepID=A0ABT3TDP8_9GAMM|nr:phospholipase D-like domain-containing protein [Candidatus Litorirhabdus singularis]MCX2979559.1 phospholipase [Candidatus Litorirhabdus singularis]
MTLLITWILDNLQLLIAGIYVGMSTAVTIHAILWKRDTKAAVGWIGLAWLSPFIGSFSYYLFGINRIQRRAVELSTRKAWRGAQRLHLTDQETVQKELFLAHPQAGSMIQLSRHLSRRYILPGNSILPLVNGDEAYPKMLAAIASAKKSVSLQSYIFDNDAIGIQFVTALAEAQKRGVAVRVMVDGVGVRYSKSPNILKPLRDAGLKHALFLPTRIPRLPNTANLRNHRKIMVVDGVHGFTGGTNIRAGHCLNIGVKSPAQCLHFSLTGPVASHLQQTFAVDWAFATGESLQGEAWFQNNERCGDSWARGINHGPDEDFEKLSDLLVGALSMARESVHIITPYFLPPAALTQVLAVTAMRGVEVNILLPSRNNIRIMDWATQAEIGPLLEKGCNIIVTPEPFDHTKLLVVDDAWSLIGSTNWDQRSLRLNFEFNVECYDRDLAMQLKTIFTDKAANGRQLRLSDINDRSLAVKFRDGAARLWAPYL